MTAGHNLQELATLITVAGKDVSDKREARLAAAVHQFADILIRNGFRHTEISDALSNRASILAARKGRR